MKNLEYVWSIICSMSSTDEETKNISLLNLIERFNIGISTQDKRPDVNSPAKVGVNFELVSRFMKMNQEEDISFDYRTTLISPDGKSLGETNQKTIAFRKGSRNIRIRTKFNEFILTTSGVYFIRVEYRKTESGSYQLASNVPVEVNVEER